MTEKTYLENPYLLEFKAKIIKKEKIDDKYYITLNRTIFYPHMCGGQPRDNGSINGVEVVDVFEKDGEIIHVVDENIDSKLVSMSIDWNVRFDHMQQHTGQHLLSAVIYKLYNGKTVGFHLGSDYVYIDIDIPHFSASDIERVEKFANSVIYSNFKVKNYIINKDDVEKIGLRKQPIVDSNIRIVEIDNIDLVPCAGTHCSNIGEVGILKIRKWERYKGNNTRIEFVCGNRALKDYTWKNTYINNISSLLSFKDIDTYAGVENLLNINKNLKKEIKNLKEELLMYKSKELLNNNIKINDIQIVNEIFDNGNTKEIRDILSNLISNSKTICVLGIKSNERFTLILGRSKDLHIDMIEILKESLSNMEWDGGGNSQIAQGICTIVEKFDECIESSLNLIKLKI